MKAVRLHQYRERPVVEEVAEPEITDPLDVIVRIGGDSGKPIVVSYPESPSAIALTEISQKIAAQVSVAALSAKNELPINIVE